MIRQPVEYAELKWRCRRGMLELDILLNSYLDSTYPAMSQEQGAVFSAILDYPDQVLLDLLMGNMQSSDAAINSMVSAIRAVKDKRGPAGQQVEKVE